LNYPICNRFKTDQLTEDERLIESALSSYSFDPDEYCLTDFVPFDTLYRAYSINAPPPRLDRVHFGIALRRVFAITELYCSRRWVEGKYSRGFICMRGPGGVVVQSKPGNPRKAGKGPVWIH
jgi:hypothetical protein